MWARKIIIGFSLITIILVLYMLGCTIGVLRLHVTYNIYLGIGLIIGIGLLFFWGLALSTTITDKEWFLNFDELVETKQKLKEVFKENKKYVGIIGEHEAIKFYGEKEQTAPRTAYLNSRYRMHYKNASSGNVSSIERRMAKERLSEIELFIHNFPEFKEATKID